MVAGRPEEDVPIPAVVEELAAGSAVSLEWRNEVGGLTFTILDERGWFVKWNPHGNLIDLPREIERLSWAGKFITVPLVIDDGSDAEGAWFVSEPIDARSAVDPEWKARPEAAVRAVGKGLRHMHDTLPVADCPFPWPADDRIADAHERASDGRLEAGRWPTRHVSMTLEQAMDFVAEPPPIDQLVVCHGDSCAPNTLVANDGSFAAHVDLGSLGVADRWADLAIATWSTEWNYGPGWEDILLDAYGIAPDPDRTAYYRVLWELGP